MIKGSEKRHAQHPVNSVFIDRWSPRGMTGEPVSEQELMTLFEAARWAPSASNLQPWRILYARRDTPQWPVFFDLLVEANQTWAQRAGALLLFVAQSEGYTRPSTTFSYDTGAAWQNLALQGFMLGLAVHGIGGFHRDRAPEVLKIPAHFRVEAMAVVGRPGKPELLPERYQALETPADNRRPVSESVCEGVFAFA